MARDYEGDKLAAAAETERRTLQRPNTYERDVELRKMDKQFDGCFVGQNGSVGSSLHDVKPVQPKYKRSDELIVYVNGIWTEKNQQAEALEMIAFKTGHPAVGIHNATEDHDPKGIRLKDVNQVWEDKQNKGENRAAQQVSDTVYNEVKAGRSVYLMGHSHGGLCVSRGLFDVRERLANDAQREQHCSRALAYQNAEAKMHNIKVESFGAAATHYPDGPQYVHHVNRADFVPAISGIDPHNGGYGRGAVIDNFNTVPGDPAAHDFNNTYLNHWAPFDRSRAGHSHDYSMARPYEDLSRPQLDKKRTDVEDRFYWARHDGTPPQGRKELEVDWNAVRHEQSHREGKTWNYKFDRRDEFEIRERVDTNRRGQAVDTISVHGKAHPPEHTIDWTADTHIGKKRYDEIQKEQTKTHNGNGQPLVSPKFGIDPEGVNAGRSSRTGHDPLTGVEPHRPNYQRGTATPAANNQQAENTIAQATRRPDAPPAEIKATQTATTDQKGHRVDSPPTLEAPHKSPQAHAPAPQKEATPSKQAEAPTQKSPQPKRSR